MEENSETQTIRSQSHLLNQSIVKNQQESQCNPQNLLQKSKDQGENLQSILQPKVEQPENQIIQLDKAQAQEAFSTSINQEYKPDKNTVYKHNIMNLLSLMKKGTDSMELNHDLERQFEEVDKLELKALWQAIYQSLLSSKKPENDLQEEQSLLNQAHDYSKSESEKISNSDFSHENINFLEHIDKEKKPSNQIQSTIIHPPVGDKAPSSTGTVKAQDKGFNYSAMSQSSFENTRFSNKIVQHRESKVKKSDPTIFKYLLQLRNAQTQLTYLCQYFNWLLTFKGDVYQEEKKTNYLKKKSILTSKVLNKTHKYTCKVEVITTKNKNSKQIIGYCEMANSKKEARHVASLVCLYQLYHSLEGIWEQYEEQKKKNPSLKQDLNANNYDTLIYAGFPIPEYEQTQQNQDNTAYFNFSKKPKQQYIPKYSTQTKAFQFENPEETNLEHYISNIKNYKKELDQFIESNQLTFLEPKWEFYMNNGYWEVKASIEYTGPESKQTIYAANNRNMMVAQENVCRKILLDLYSQQNTLFKRFLEIKNAKGPY